MKIFSLMLSILILFSTHAFAEENIKYLAEGQVSPKANIQQAAWIAGQWTGEAFGAFVEENWSAPKGNSMMASFRMISDGKVKFYELEIIREINDSLILELKHFTNELKGWETKEQTVAFPLVEITQTTIYFDGMTFKKIGENEMHVFVDIDNNGKQTEAIFVYKK